MYRPSWIRSILLIQPILTLGPRPIDHLFQRTKSKNEKHLLVRIMATQARAVLLLAEAFLSIVSQFQWTPVLARFTYLPLYSISDVKTGKRGGE